MSISLPNHFVKYFIDGVIDNFIYCMCTPVYQLIQYTYQVFYELLLTPLKPVLNHLKYVLFYSLPMISPPANVCLFLKLYNSYSYINQRKMQVSINFHNDVSILLLVFKNFSRNLNQYDKIVKILKDVIILLTIIVMLLLKLSYLSFPADSQWKIIFQKRY